MLALVIIIAACFAAQLATVATLFLALIANAAILVVAASAFHATGHTHVTEIQNDAHRQRQAEQEMQRQRAAQHLGEIGPTARRRAAQRRCGGGARKNGKQPGDHDETRGWSCYTARPRNA